MDEQTHDPLFVPVALLHLPELVSLQVQLLRQESLLFGELAPEILLLRLLLFPELLDLPSKMFLLA